MATNDILQSLMALITGGGGSNGLQSMLGNWSNWATRQDAANREAAVNQRLRQVGSGAWQGLTNIVGNKGSSGREVRAGANAASNRNLQALLSGDTGGGGGVSSLLSPLLGGLFGLTNTALGLQGGQEQSNLDHEHATQMAKIQHDYQLGIISAEQANTQANMVLQHQQSLAENQQNANLQSSLLGQQNTAAQQAAQQQHQWSVEDTRRNQEMERQYQEWYKRLMMPTAGGSSIMQGSSPATTGGISGNPNYSSFSNNWGGPTWDSAIDSSGKVASAARREKTGTSYAPSNKTKMSYSKLFKQWGLM